MSSSDKGFRLICVPSILLTLLYSHYRHGAELLRKADTATNSFLAVSETFASRKETLLDILEGVFVVSIPQVSRANESTQALFSPIDQSIEQQAMIIVEALKELDPTIYEEVGDIGKSLQSGEEACEEISSTLDEANLQTVQIATGIVFTALPIMMLFILLLAVYGVKSECMQCLSSCFILPAFVLFILFLLSATCVAGCRT